MIQGLIFKRIARTICVFFAACALSGCARETGDCHGTQEPPELRRLMLAASSANRDDWFPAARKLGRIAASDRALRDRIWLRAGVNTLGMKFVRIEPGEFWMGPPYQDNLWTHEPHAVRLTRPFYICVTETTNEQYEVLRPEHQPEPRFSPDPESPVVDLSWDDVQAFCKDLSDREGAVFRLPTEAEWEYVCRAGMPSPHLFCFGDDFKILPEYAWCAKRRSSAAPVALLRPNAWGVYDMHGNALELVADRFSTDFNGARADVVAVDPQGPLDGFNHTLRGGEWYSADVSGCECAARMPWPFLSLSFSVDTPRLRQTIGFRIVRECETATTQKAPQAGEAHEQTRRERSGSRWVWAGGAWHDPGLSLEPSRAGNLRFLCCFVTVGLRTRNRRLPGRRRDARVLPVDPGCAFSGS